MTLPPRDVPPPRPVEPEPTTGPLARAARSVADAVGGLLGDRPDGEEPAGKGGRAGAVLRDVVTAVGTAARGARGTEEGTDRDPGAGSGWHPGTVLTDLLHAAAPGCRSGTAPACGPRTRGRTRSRSPTPWSPGTPGSPRASGRPPAG
ncbi:hypothetical protein ACFQX8_11120 [Klenkia terrae]|uniref:hypothetical protein n=1 Tax=Klenkia terrae TaxID=1052259 RepID=UPI0036186578